MVRILDNNELRVNNTQLNYLPESLVWSLGGETLKSVPVRSGSGKITVHQATDELKPSFVKWTTSVDNDNLGILNDFIDNRTPTYVIDILNEAGSNLPVFSNMTLMNNPEIGTEIEFHFEGDPIRQ